MYTNMAFVIVVVVLFCNLRIFSNHINVEILSMLIPYHFLQLDSSVHSTAVVSTLFQNEWFQNSN